MKRPVPVRWPRPRLPVLSPVRVWGFASPGKTRAWWHLRLRATGSPVLSVRGGPPRLGAGPWRHRRSRKASGWQGSPERCVLPLRHAPRFASFVTSPSHTQLPTYRNCTKETSHRLGLKREKSYRLVRVEFCGNHALAVAEGRVYL